MSLLSAGMKLESATAMSLFDGDGPFNRKRTKNLKEIFKFYCQ